MLTRAAVVAAAVMAVAVLGAAPALAQPFEARNDLIVGQISPSVYEVTGRPGKSGAANFWCAAADYARHRLGASGSVRVYVAQARGPSTVSAGRSAVRFTLDPAGAGIDPIAPRTSLSVGHVGDNIGLRAAEEYCIVEINRF